MKRFVGVCALVISLAGATGCTTEGATPDSAAQAYLRALGEGNADKACQMTISFEGEPFVKGTPEHRRCVSSVEQWMDRTPELKSLKKVKVTGARLNGAGANVEKADMTGVHNPPVPALYLTKRGKLWYVSPLD